MNEALILIGIIMIVAGIFVFYFGYKRSVPNMYLWAAFPILHGLHEFADYFAFQLPIIFERLEIFFAISGSFVLLAAALEYNGIIARPVGKFAALIGLVAVSYYIFGLSEEALEEIENSVFDFGILKTNPFRFFQGFFMTILAILAIVFTSLYLYIRSREGELSIDRRFYEINGASIILLSIYAFFEGFESEDPVFITLRAISLSLFIIVPIFFILVNKIGLQRLFIIQSSGVPIVGYKFPTNSFISIGSSEGSDFILAAGFLSAISTFSGNVLKSSSTFSIRSKQLYFIITQVNGNLYALQTLHTNRALEKVFFEFGKRLNPKIPLTNNVEDIDEKMVESEIKNSFGLYL